MNYCFKVAPLQQIVNSLLLFVCLLIYLGGGGLLVVVFCFCFVALGLLILGRLVVGFLKYILI